MRNIIDLHMHVVPNVDDGSRSIDESLKMLKLAASQGVADVFCTSHNSYSKEYGARYLSALSNLKNAVSEAQINVRLHKGCEVLCAGEYINDIIHGLDIGALSALGNSKCVLTELYSDAKLNEALAIIRALIEHGYKPIIAHAERNYNITSPMVRSLIESGAQIQVNAFSFVNEKDEGIRKRARNLLRNKYVHFIGSDAHRMDHRPPDIVAGVAYVMQNADEDYAMKILFENAKTLI